MKAQAQVLSRSSRGPKRSHRTDATRSARDRAGCRPLSWRHMRSKYANPTYVSNTF